MPTDQLLRDPLTLVYSRSSLGFRLSEEVNRSLRYKHSFSILLLDVDYFKSVNDAFGHTRGDKTLVELARRLIFTARKTDIIFRYGGDEFVIILPSTDREQATRLGERLNEVVRTAPFGDIPPLSLTISIGIACFPDDAHSAEELFEIADQRHYAAKINGRDQIVAIERSPGKEKALEDYSRLIERDESLDVLNHFIETLPEHGRGVFHVRGGPGLGNTRFLSEARKIANLRGYATLNLTGTPGLKYRYFGVLLDGIRGSFPASLKLGNLEPDWISGEQLTGLLKTWITEKGKAGLLITLDDLHNFDTGSLNLTRSLFFSSIDSPIGLIYSDRGTAIGRGFPYETSLQAATTLTPLSPKGVQVWLRHGCKWEAQSQFIDWLHQETGGKPAFIQAGLSILLKNDIISQQNGSCGIAKDFAQFPLSSALETLRKSSVLDLPVIQNELIGRAKEIKNIKELLAAHRLVTLYGFEGVGKSRLALQIAYESQNDFSDGIYLIPVNNVSSDEQFLLNIANALDLSLTGNQPTRKNIIEAMIEKHILMIFDHIERYHNSVSLLSDIIQNTHTPRCLVTSLSPLNIEIESAFELPGLPCPKETSVAACEASSATQLFVQKARRLQPDFNLKEEDIPEMVKICHIVAGNPLGIELAAGLINVVPFNKIASQIEINPSVLDIETQGLNDSPGLWAIIDSFWQLLSPAEQSVLQRLALFEGSFNEEAARSIASASIFFLDALISKSLLQRSAPHRYTLHELLRHHLLRKFDVAPGDLANTQVLFTQFYASQMKIALSIYHQGDEKNAFSIILPDMENFKSACKWAVHQKSFTEFIDLVDGLFRFFESRGQFHSGLAIFSDMVQMIRASESLHTDPAWLSCYGKAVVIYGKFLFHTGQFHDSLVNIEEGLSIFRKNDSRNEIAFALHELASPVRASGDYSRAASLLEECLAYYRSTDNREGVGDVLNNLGVINSLQGNNQKSERLFQESLTIFHLLDHQGKIARAFNNIGSLLTDEGRYREARKMLEESLSASRAIGVTALTASTEGSLGYVTFRMGQFEESQKHYLEGLKISLELKATPLLLELLVGLAELWNQYGKKEAAYEILIKIRDHSAITHDSQERAVALLEQILPQITSLPGPGKTEVLEDYLQSILYS